MRGFLRIILLGVMLGVLSACATGSQPPRPGQDCAHPAKPVDGGMGGTGVSSECGPQ